MRRPRLREIDSDPGWLPLCRPGIGVSLALDDLVAATSEDPLPVDAASRVQGGWSDADVHH